MERAGIPPWISYAVAFVAVVVVVFALLQMRDPTVERLTTRTFDSHGFTASYPEGFVIDEQYVYAGMGDTGDISGVSFSIPSHYTRGTNLSTDTRASVEVYRGAGTVCNAGVFLAAAQSNPEAMDGEVKEAAAGNLYEESVFVIEKSSPCTAVRYFIHSTNIDNYPEGSVQAFDRAAVQGLFDTIRTSVVLAR